MEITDTLVDKLATLARLRFDSEDKVAIREDLQKMIRFVDKLNEVDTSGIEPLLFISDNVNIFRNDVEQQECTRDDALKNVPYTDGEFIKVLKVINK